MKYIRTIVLGFCILALLAGTALFIFLPFITVFQVIIFYILVLLITYVIDNVIKYILHKSESISEATSTNIPQTKTLKGKTGHVFQNNLHLQDRHLYTVESIWPFMLFPDKLIIEEEDVIIFRKKFISSGSSETILIKDIFSIIINSGPFFASIVIQRKTSIPGTDSQILIHYLPKKQAIIAKELIDGLLLEKSDSVKLNEEAPVEQRVKDLISVGKNEMVAQEL